MGYIAIELLGQSVSVRDDKHTVVVVMWSDIAVLLYAEPLSLKVSEM